MTKKYWIVALLALGIAGCSDDDKIDPPPTPSPATECSNNNDCAAKYTDGSKPVCNAQGICEAASQKECENNNDCIAKDPNKPVCNAQGICEEAASQKECENNNDCIAKDPNKPVCNAQGICEEAASQKECENNDECIAKDPNKPVCNSDGICEAAPIGKECSNNGECELKYTDKPVCNAQGMCEAQSSTDSCEEAEIIEADYKWCQLMGPIKVELDSETATATLNARVIYGGITDKTRGNDGELEAQLIYGEDVTAKDLATWPHVDAIGVNIDDCIMDGYSASLSNYNLSLLNSDKALYTFRFKKVGEDDSEWIYCKYNDDDENEVDRSLSYMMIDDDGKVDANAHVIGEANFVGNTDNIIAKFDFDKGEGTMGKNTPYTADAGTGQLQVFPISASCQNSRCYGNHDSGQALNIGGFTSTRKEALEKGVHILISGMNTADASDINLEMSVYRNHAESPDKMVILYSIDGETYVEQGDISLYPEGTAADKQTGIYYPLAVSFPSAVNDAESFSIKLVPYGVSNKNLRLDDIVISKNND